MAETYGLPEHLFSPVAHAVKIALQTAVWGESFHYGLDLRLLTQLWAVRVEQDIHTELMVPSRAEELLAVIQPAIEGVAEQFENSPDDLDPADIDLDFHSEEIVMTLQSMFSLVAA